MNKRFVVRERIVVEAGYRQVYRPLQDETTRQPQLATYQPGQRVRPRARIEQRRGLTESELIAQMQTSGVGRPSTYALTLEALRARGYLAERDDALVVTETGLRVLEFLGASYPVLLEIGWTARLEQILDSLAAGRIGYRQAVNYAWKELEHERCVCNGVM